MEFEEMKKIWDMQSNKPLYAINEEALHRRIISKKKGVLHAANFSELLLILANIAAGIFLLVSDYSKPGFNIFAYIMAAWMLASAVFILIWRIRRLRKGDEFDRSLNGDLNHAISVTTYQNRLNNLMRWNIVPICVLTLMGVWGGDTSVWEIVAILCLFGFAFYATGWENHCYKSKKKELESLREKLEDRNGE